MKLIDSLLMERERAATRRAQQEFTAAEQKQYWQALATIRELYATLTAEQELAEKPAVEPRRGPVIDRWYSPTCVERRVVGGECLEAHIQLGNSDAMYVLRTWLEVYSIADDGTVLRQPDEITIQDYISWLSDSAPVRAVYEPTLDFARRLSQLAVWQQGQAQQAGQTSA